MQHSGFTPEQQQMDFREISTITTVLQSLCCFFPFRKPVADLIQGSFSFIVFYSSRMDILFPEFLSFTFHFSQPQGSCISLQPPPSHLRASITHRELGNCFSGLQWLWEQLWNNRVLPCGAETWKTSSVVHYPPLTNPWNTFLRLWQRASSLSCQ